jgi:hypothetical protein
VISSGKLEKRHFTAGNGDLDGIILRIDFIESFGICHPLDIFFVDMDIENRHVLGNDADSFDAHFFVLRVAREGG